MSEQIVYMCSKSAELDQIQSDIRDLKKSNQQIREKLFNGLSTDVPIIRKTVEKLVRIVSKMEGEKEVDSESNKRPKIPRIVGTIIIVVTFVVTLTGAAWFLLAIGAVDAEGIGKMIGAAIP